MLKLIYKLRHYASSRPWVVRTYLVFTLLAAPPVIACAGIAQIFADEWPTFWRDFKNAWRTRKVDP